jgi:hypothetical protein
MTMAGRASSLTGEGKAKGTFQTSSNSGALIFQEIFESLPQKGKLSQSEIISGMFLEMENLMASSNGKSEGAEISNAELDVLCDFISGKKDLHDLLQRGQSTVKTAYNPKGSEGEGHTISQEDLRQLHQMISSWGKNSGKKNISPDLCRKASEETGEFPKKKDEGNSPAESTVSIPEEQSRSVDLLQEEFQAIPAVVPEGMKKTQDQDAVKKGPELLLSRKGKDKGIKLFQDSGKGVPPEEKAPALDKKAYVETMEKSPANEKPLNADTSALTGREAENGSSFFEDKNTSFFPKDGEIAETHRDSDENITGKTDQTFISENKDPLSARITSYKILNNTGTEALHESIANVINVIKNRKGEKKGVLSVDPPDLGKLKIVVDSSDEKINVHITVEKLDSGELLKGSEDNLRSALKRQGLSMGELSVDVGGGEGRKEAPDQGDLHQNMHGKPPGPDILEEEIPTMARLDMNKGWLYWIA